ncbi:spermatogenesis associated 6-like protein isoform X7 [Girardinichthys multiradiatus]|uniref:spermatogenesis associated 6-like protein isoform X7 n=1 Tax=Girardinichthys multiradiatus TaxID=208333 RepID=UPI001FABE60E|nr:spermatogenesis associated 6-like protein isoform X7 [Girardinichthys multiradiatus]
MSRKALKVLAEIKIRAVSCPGVHLSAKDDIYLRMDFMGQFHQSECLPAVFPLLFHEKMTFEKIFRHAVDPGDIAVLLKYEAVRIELVQLIPPDHVHFVAGDTLACFEEDARSFLFPEPKLVPPFSGVGREVLMRTAAHFPGIAPRLEFSTRTTITECPPDTEVTICPKTPIRPAIRRKLRRSSIPRSTPPQTAWGRESVRMDRERPRTVKPLLYIPRSQSMSPGRENIQNLAQLSIDSAPPLTSDWETRSQPMNSLLSSLLLCPLFSKGPTG